MGSKIERVTKERNKVWKKREIYTYTHIRMRGTIQVDY